MTDGIMPQMGESIAEGTVTKWLKNICDTVERDEPLFEISTDKVDAEIPAPASGVLAEIRVQPGTTVPINTVVGIIASGEVAASSPGPAVAPVAAAVAPAGPAPAGARAVRRPAVAPPAPLLEPSPAPAPSPVTAPHPVAAPPPAPERPRAE